MTNFTPEDLLLYIYKESSPQLTRAIEQAVNTDWALREKLNVIKDSAEKLDTIIAEPREKSVLKILAYARKTETVTAEH
mgnify:CR=1 FL=1